MTLLLLLAGASNVESSNEYPQTDDVSSVAHDFSGWQIWLTPDDVISVEDFLLGVETPVIDATYTLVHNFDGWTQQPLNVDAPIDVGGGGSSIPVIDETYDFVYDYDGWQLAEVQTAGPVIRTQIPPAQSRTQTPPTQSRSTTSPSQSRTQTPPRDN